MDDRQAAIAAELAKLCNAYRERMPREIAELAECATGLIGLIDDKETLLRLETLHRRLHKLAGSGGSFGLEVLSHQARILENTVQTWLATDFSTVDEAQRRRFADTVADLAACSPPLNESPKE